MLRRGRSIPIASHRYPSGRRTSLRPHPRRHIHILDLEPLEPRRLLTTYYVSTTADNGSDSQPTPGSLRAAIVQSNENLDGPGPNAIVFQLPAESASNPDAPAAGFDPATQTWTITPQGALPPITAPVDIDGFTEANVGVPYLYPAEAASGAAPTEITTVPNTTAAIDGNNARIRVIIDGSDSDDGIGFDLETQGAMLRGLIIDNFGVGVEIPGASDVGNSIQGDFIGGYLLYPVDPNSGTPLPKPEDEEIVSGGNQDQGVIVNGANTTLGGASPQDDVVIAGNQSQGVWIQSGALGTQVLGCQIGAVGPSDDGVYWPDGNQAEGVLVQSSSDLIGAAGAGNIISCNAGDGVQLDQGVTQVQVAANFIGVPPGGGYEFGNGLPGNGGDGVDLIGAANNTVGGASSGAGNAISSNALNGVAVSGTSATGNIISYNLIGVTSDGSQALGNGEDGVTVSSSQNQIGPGNVISANQVGVDIWGAATTGATVTGNLIGTDETGEFDLGNTYQGVLVDGASGVTIQGNGAGSQVISGNDVGIELTDSASGALIEGTFIGTDKTGAIALPNAQQGILIDGNAWENTIGGTSSTSRNLISANHWGLVIDGPASGPADNSVTGNLIGTDITGQLPLGNEIDGVTITDSSGNTIGGITAAQGNTIAFNTDAGVHVVSGNADTIESNSIFSNGTLGIQLDGSSNDNIPAPTVTEALPDTGLGTTEIDLSYVGVPDSTYLLQFFSTPGAVVQGGVEGETDIGATSIRTDSNGNIIGQVNGIFAVDIPGVVDTGDWVTSTATVISTPSGSGLVAGDTSEFFNLPIPPNPTLTRATNPFLVTSLADTGALGTLRAAILFSNGHPSTTGPNDIRFQIPGTGLQTIELQTALPPITAPLTIDGYSQPGSTQNDSSQFLPPDTADDQETDIATIQIQVDGSQIPGGGTIGLDVQSAGCTIDGLSLTGFDGAAIFLEPGSSTVTGLAGDTVWGNFIGVSQFSPHSTDPVAPATNSEANGVGILIDSSNNVIGGSIPVDRNVIQGNMGDGVILFGGGTGNTIGTNFILDNGGDGVLVLSPSNHIGQASGVGLAGAGNLISGNAGNGVHILGTTARGNTVANNEIGTQVGLAGQQVPILGTSARANGLSGVLIEDAPANVVGGLVAGSANVIAGNRGDGVTIEDYSGFMIPAIVSQPPPTAPGNAGTRNVIEGNLIGFNNRNYAVEPIPNDQDGVDLAATGNTVGGSVTAARNIIGANLGNGITITAPANVVAGNYIGTVSGNDDYGNTGDGILIDQAGANTLGGSAAGAGNVIANASDAAGIQIEGSQSTGNIVEGDQIGTTADGTAPLSNRDGIELEDAPGNVIGGTTPGAANVIAGNTDDGLYLDGSGASSNLVEGDFIGTDANGSGQLGNGLDGVTIDGGASDNTVGGTTSGAGDVIADNGGVGVHVVSGTGNSILSDSIFSNAATGIVLVGSANDGQAAPTIASATPLTTETLVAGTLASAPSTTFLIQAFTSTTADAAGSYEGQTLVGSTTVTTDSGGQAGFSLALPGSIPLGAAITATATNLATGDTSAFSTDALNAPLIAFAAARFSVSEPASSALITVTRNTGVGSSTVLYAAGPGTAIPGVDFTPVSAALTFAPGQTTATFSVPIIATQGRLGQFTVDLSLSNPSGAGLGAPTAAVLTIQSSPGTLQFRTSTVVVPESGGDVTVTVDRVGGASGTVGVSYSTASISAIPGADYLPVSGTLTFAPGVTQQSFTLPILGNSPNPDDATLALALSGATGGASLGSPTTEDVTIDKPLIVTGEQLTTGGRGITSIVLSFNKPLDPTQAVNLANYGVFVYWSDVDGIFEGGGTTTPLSSVSYNPASLTVTLLPSAPLLFGRLYRLDVNDNASTVLGNGLVDTLGGQLEGSSGVPGTPDLVTFGAGKKLTYVDAASNLVTLQLHRGGIMELFQAPSGDVQQLGLVGTVPRRSTLSGTVKRGHGGNGRTTLPPISGAGGVHIKLKGRPFVVARPALIADEGRPFARRAWHR